MAGSGLKLKRGCKACEMLKGNTKLVKRIYASKEYVKGGESLLSISNDIGIRYDALRNHCKKHQALDADKLAEAQMKVIEKKVTDQAVRKLVRSGDARQDVVDKLYSLLENVNPDELSGRDVVSLLLKATKDTDDVAAKKRDQDVDILKMMGSIRSGEVTAEKIEAAFNPWDEAEEAEWTDAT